MTEWKYVSHKLYVLVAPDGEVLEEIYGDHSGFRWTVSSTKKTYYGEAAAKTAAENCAAALDTLNRHTKQSSRGQRGGVMKFRKKPVVIEATQWFKNGDHPAVLLMPPDQGAAPQPYIHTLEGPLLVTPGDWIITGVQGENYPCKPDIFAATYEPAEETK